MFNHLHSYEIIVFPYVFPKNHEIIYHFYHNPKFAPSLLLLFFGLFPRGAPRLSGGRQRPGRLRHVRQGGAAAEVEIAWAARQHQGLPAGGEADAVPGAMEGTWDWDLEKVDLPYNCLMAMESILFRDFTYW